VGEWWSGGGPGKSRGNPGWSDPSLGLGLFWDTLHYLKKGDRQSERMTQLEQAEGTIQTDQ